MKRRFKSRAMQEVYDYFRANPPANPDTAASKGGCHSAYRVGFRFPHLPPRHLRDSMAYAGWAAGIDNARSKS